MEEIAIVIRRRDEVLANVAKARKAIEAAKAVIEEGESELLDLDITGRTLAKLTGAEWPAASPADAAKETEPNIRHRERPAVRSAAGMNTTQMILEAYKADAQAGGKGLEPRQAADWVRLYYGVDVKNEYVSSIVWRLAQRGQLQKVGEGTYTVSVGNLIVKEAPDQLPLGDGSEASVSQPTQAGEGRAGGGG